MFQLKECSQAGKTSANNLILLIYCLKIMDLNISWFCSYGVDMVECKHSTFICKVFANQHTPDTTYFKGDDLLE